MQIFADFCRSSPFPGKQSIWGTQIFRRKPQIFAGTHRKPQEPAENRRSGFVPLGRPLKRGPKNGRLRSYLPHKPTSHDLDFAHIQTMSTRHVAGVICSAVTMRTIGLLAVSSKLCLKHSNSQHSPDSGISKPVVWGTSDSHAFGLSLPWVP